MTDVTDGHTPPNNSMYLGPAHKASNSALRDLAASHYEI